MSSSRSPARLKSSGKAGRRKPRTKPSWHSASEDESAGEMIDLTSQSVKSEDSPVKSSGRKSEATRKLPAAAVVKEIEEAEKADPVDGVNSTPHSEDQHQQPVAEVPIAVAKGGVKPVILIQIDGEKKPTLAQGGGGTMGRLQATRDVLKLDIEGMRYEGRPYRTPSMLVLSVSSQKGKQEAKLEGIAHELVRAKFTSDHLVQELAREEIGEDMLDNDENKAFKAKEAKAKKEAKAQKRQMKDDLYAAGKRKKKKIPAKGKTTKRRKKK